MRAYDSPEIADDGPAVIPYAFARCPGGWHLQAQTEGARAAWYAAAGLCARRWGLEPGCARKDCGSEREPASIRRPRPPRPRCQPHLGRQPRRLFSAVEVTQTALGIPRRRLRSLGSRRAHSRSEAKSFCGESSFFCDNTVRARAGVSTRVAECAGGGREGEGEHRDGGVHGRWRRVAGWRAAHIRGAEDFAVRVYQQRFFAALTPRVPRTEFISARCAVRGARVYQPRPKAGG